MRLERAAMHKPPGYDPGHVLKPGPPEQARLRQNRFVLHPGACLEPGALQSDPPTSKSFVLAARGLF